MSLQVELADPGGEAIRLLSQPLEERSHRLLPDWAQTGQVHHPLQALQVLSARPTSTIADPKDHQRMV